MKVEKLPLTTGNQGHLPELVSETIAAQLLGGLAVQTLRGWRVRNKYLPYYKLGGLVRYKISDLEQFLESRAVKTAGGLLPKEAA